MLILGIETSCDETGCAILKKYGNRITILSNVVASSAQLQAKYGGVIPEQAAREQIKAIIPVIEETLRQAQCKPDGLDAIAVTYGPGLIGSLLVGVETAKTLALIWDKPLIPINHLLGHFYANFIQVPSSKLQVPIFPCIGLLISGGHTDLVLFTNHGKYVYLGGTRDDAAGECFDKCARLLGLPYPGGPHISKLAQKGNPAKFKLPIPMKNSKDLDFSYSGLKTSVARIVGSGQVTGNSKQDLAATIEETIIISLIDKLLLASKIYTVEQIMVAGGVAANKKLNEKIIKFFPCHRIFIPPANLCTDNGAMIATAGFFQKPIKNPFNLQADPNLSL